MFDLLIKGGRKICGTSCEIGVIDKKIAAVAQSLEGEAKEVLDITGSYISPGWIDDHVHCYEKMKLYYDYPDQIGVEKGVTTVIDAGTTGAENIGDFYELANLAATNVYALVNISKWGIVEQDELADLSKVQEKLVAKALADYPDFIVGIKARMSKTVIGENGITPLEMAKDIQKKHSPLPLMVHIGSTPPELEEIMDVMEAGDILTHCFHGKPNGILDQKTGGIKPFALEAYRKGIIFDVGHGTDSFNFHVAEVALAEGIKAASISTDIYHKNRVNGPVYDLSTTMEKLHVVGYSWDEILDKVTIAPAKIFHLAGKGQIREGYDADFTIFNFAGGVKELVDSNGYKRVTKTQLQPVRTVIGGRVYQTQAASVKAK